jgi:O-antigen/teichoic acid export membrane protein
MQVSAGLMFPFFAAIALTADDLVRVVLGEQWAPFVRVLQLYSIVAAAQPILNILLQSAVAAGGSRAVASAGLVTLIVMPPAFLLLSSAYGVIGLAAGWLIPMPFVAYLYASSLAKLVGITPLSLARGLVRPLAGAAGVTVAVLVLQSLPAADLASPSLRLASSLLLAGLFHLCLFYCLQRPDFRWLCSRLLPRTVADFRLKAPAYRSRA